MKLDLRGQSRQSAGEILCAGGCAFDPDDTSEALGERQREQARSGVEVPCQRAAALAEHQPDELAGEVAIGLEEATTARPIAAPTGVHRKSVRAPGREEPRRCVAAVTARQKIGTGSGKLRDGFGKCGCQRRKR
jgi:hypothetical protein